MLTKKGGDWYGTCAKDIWFALVNYSEDGVFAYHFPICECGHTTFSVELILDERNFPDEYASRTCVRCDTEHRMIDADDVGDAPVSRLRCECGGEAFELLGAVGEDEPA